MVMRITKFPKENQILHRFGGLLILFDLLTLD